jgi:hypothetical protein
VSGNYVATHPSKWVSVIDQMLPPVAAWSNDRFLAAYCRSLQASPATAIPENAHPKGLLSAGAIRSRVDGTLSFGN